MLLRLLPACLAALVIATPAAAHIVFAEPTASAGGYYAGFLRVSHGCGGSDTRSLRVEIPSSILIARPQPKPGWTLSVEKQPLKDPIKSEGGQMLTERVSAVIWTGDLPADQFDQFGIMLKLPATSGPLFFPTRQKCDAGENAWINVPATPDDWHKTATPAPMLIVGDGHMDMKM